MNAPNWRYTKLDELHPDLPAAFALEADERALVTFLMDASHWYVMTTGRVLGANDGLIAFRPLEVTSAKWGNFKYGTEDATTEARFDLVDGRTVRLVYEVGYASMAPIYYDRFWNLQYPILGKLAL